MFTTFGSTIFSVSIINLCASAMELWSVALCLDYISFVYERNPAVISTLVWLMWAENNKTEIVLSWTLLGVNLL